MFCYQCQETAKGTGCTIRGVCGKSDSVAALQDLLIHVLKGLGYYGTRARALGIVDHEADLLLTEGLFATITNANFDEARFVAYIERAVQVREELAGRYREAFAAKHGNPPTEPLPEEARWFSQGADQAGLIAAGSVLGVLADPDLPEDYRSLRELIIYGLKGMAAYAHHASVLGYESDEIFAFMHKALAATTDASLSADDLTALAVECGSVGVQTMALLDQANTTRFGNPEITQVNLGVKPGPAILVSGHDLRDLSELLEQTQGTGVNVYTHGEMLPANAYPALKKYENLVGNYGGSWWHQTEEFAKFGGAILLTTNCLVPPKESYLDRLFTTGSSGWSGATHIADRVGDAPKDFGPVIARALECGEPEELETGTIPIGFAHAAVLGVADQVVAAIKSGAIKRFVVMAGCDGRQKSRSYFTDIAEGLPADSVILTAGCAKYRYNKLDLGDIGGIPRVLDAGQCNDSYSLVAIAQALGQVFELEDLNDLPIEYDIAWYEQKAVLVLLALLSLGIKRIRLGPTLPAFVSPGVAQVLIDAFDLRPTSDVEQDLQSIVAGN